MAATLKQYCLLLSLLVALTFPSFETNGLAEARHLLQFFDPPASGQTPPASILPNFPPTIPLPAPPTKPNLPSLPLPPLPKPSLPDLPPLPKPSLPNLPPLPKPSFPFVPPLPKPSLPTGPIVPNITWPPLPSIPEILAPIIGPFFPSPPSN